jgi:hypothetical protein
VTDSTVICVLGGRSGTSLVTRILNLLGVDLGPADRLGGPGPHNPRGFWEHREIRSINDAILARYGGIWPHPLPVMPPGWHDDPALDDLLAQARQLIARDFAAALLWGWKDPRAVITLPFWRRVLPPPQRWKYVICLRNPVDTARSMRKQLETGERSCDAQTAEQAYSRALAEWHEFVGHVLAQTGDAPQLCLFYEDLMQDHGTEVTRLARFIGREPQSRDAEVRRQIDEFHDPSLQHHHTPPEQVINEPLLPAEGKRMYAELRRRVELERVEMKRAPQNEEPMTMTTTAVSEVNATANEPDPQRRKLLERVAAMTARLTENSGGTARVLVVAKPDDALFQAAGGPKAAPFPQAEDGGHAGYYPGDSTEAIAMLAAARRRGATHLLFPNTSLWWLDHYEAFRRHLGLEHNCLWRDDLIAVYQLSPLADDIDVKSSAAVSADELAYWRQTAEQRAARVKQLQQTCDSLWRRAEVQIGLAAGEDGNAKPIEQLPFDLNRIVQFPDARPIFVVGASRSGTTAMGDALKKSLDCFGWLEGHLFHLLPPVMTGVKRQWDALQKFENPDNGLRALDHFDFYDVLNRTAEQFNTVYAHRTAQAGKSRWLDKTPEPATIFAIPVLNRIYPSATFIYMHRNPIKRTLSFLKKFKEYPDATMEMGILSWKACMDGWTRIRPLLRPGSFAEFRQDDLTGKTDVVVAQLAALLDMTPEQQKIAREYFLNERPQFTGSSKDDNEMTLEDVDWSDDFKHWCVNTCGDTAAAWGYRLTRDIGAATA